MLLFFGIVTLLFTPYDGATGSLNKIKALKFSSNSYIRYSPDMSPLTNIFSICGWVKDIGSSSYRTILMYYNSIAELIIFTDGSHIALFGSYQHLQSKFSVAKGHWHHVCSTWSLESRSHSYYVNGVLLGSRQTTAGRTLKTGGELTLGMYGSSYPFDGEMMYLNVYAKELSSSEIASIVEKGMCNVETDKHESSRVIKWEELVKLRRTGTITDVYIDECLVQLGSSFDQKVAKLEGAERKLNETADELTETRQKLNATIVELTETREQLNSTLDGLTETRQELNATLDELKGLLAKQNNTWDWNIFLSEQFLNETFTTEHAQLLRSSWEDAAERLVGFTLTDKLIKLLDFFDPVENRPWSMLYSENYLNQVFTREMARRLTNIWDGISEKLVGVKMTEEVIQLLKYVTDNSNCGNS
ncbi:uncharacterized protein LOC134811069 [Bolinopsis microptera]|uniref:uncharacterized protein LOC134811069 n=1 Tax=Bolinopsis microptera TaxID=2820187 RepID=UPI003079860E